MFFKRFGHFMRFLEGFRLIYKLLMKLHDLVRKMEAKSGFYNFDLLAKIFQTIQTSFQSIFRIQRQKRNRTINFHTNLNTKLFFVHLLIKFTHPKYFSAIFRQITSHFKQSITIFIRQIFHFFIWQKF